jgi:transposase
MAVERDSGTLTETEWKRKEGMELLRSGMKQTAVAKKVGVNRRTVYEWKKRIENDHDYRSRKKAGRKSRLSVEQKETLKKIIDSGALAYGYSTDLWTLKRIADVIEKEFSVHYNTTYIWQLLDVLGYSAQMPLLSAVEKNHEYVKEWLENEYPEYVKEAREKNATILFQDESGMQSRPNVRKTWSQRGKRPVMKVRERRDKISISSAVTEDGNLYFMIVKESMNEDHIITFLDQLLSEIGGFLYLFWDNIMIHRSNKVKEYLGIHNDRLITRRIPAYSPELNPDELVWNDLKYQELPNFCPKNYDELYSKAETTLVKLKADPAKMKQIIKGTKLPLPSTLGK